MKKLKNKSKQYLFKNKINVRTKPKGELLKESILMMIAGIVLLIINYLIPQKWVLIKSFKNNIFGLLKNISELIIYSFEILFVVIICFSLLVSIFLLIGSVNRLIKVLFGKSRNFKTF